MTLLCDLPAARHVFGFPGPRPSIMETKHHVICAANASAPSGGHWGFIVANAVDPNSATHSVAVQNRSLYDMAQASMRQYAVCSTRAFEERLGLACQQRSALKVSVGNTVMATTGCTMKTCKYSKPSFKPDVLSREQGRYTSCAQYSHYTQQAVQTGDS